MSIMLTTHHPDHALYVADSVVLMGGVDDVRSGPANELLADDELTRLYGIDVQTLTYHEDGTERRSIITRYGDGSDLPS